MHLLDVIDGVRDDVALGLMSDPGLSKTSQVKQWAEKNGRRYCELIISQRMPSEISGMPMPVNDTHRMEIYDFETLLELEDGDVLAFDEFTNGNIQTLNACLTLIQERTMLSGHKLPSLVVVAMGNPQGKCDLLPQTKQRFWWVDVTWDAKTWSDYMSKTWGFVPNSKVVRKITAQYQDGFGDQAKYNYLTPRTVENLFRIAKTIDTDDEFWEISAVDHELVTEIYASMKSIEKFLIVQSQLKDWLEAQVEGTAYYWTPLVTEGLDACRTMADLREYIKALEAESIAPEFVEFMKTNKSEDEPDE